MFAMRAGRFLIALVLLYGIPTLAALAMIGQGLKPIVSFAVILVPTMAILSLAFSVFILKIPGFGVLWPVYFFTPFVAIHVLYLAVRWASMPPRAATT